MLLCKETVIIDENRVSSRERNRKNIAAEIKPSSRVPTENNTKQPAVTVGALEIPAVKKGKNLGQSRSL